MFGYFRPYHSCLTRKQLRLFNSYYCRLCYCLRLLGGQAARALTTFDVAIYSMILNLQMKGADPPKLSCQRLSKKNIKNFVDDEIGLKLARLTFISFGEKFRDDKLDGNGKQTGFFSALYKKPIEEAKATEPELARIAYDGTEKINVLQDGNAPLDEVFSAYGDMMVASFERFAFLSPEYCDLFRAVGEWTFFVDMVCDYADDYKSGSYNGFKTEGCPTFGDYFSVHYADFMQIEEKITGRLVSCLYAIKADDSLWYTLFKIIMQAADNVIPSLIEGKDVTFHYFAELRKQHKQIAHEKKLRHIYQGD